MSEENKNRKSAAAMIEMFEQTGALDTKNTARGAKFLAQLFETAYGDTKEGIESAFRSGEDPSQYLSQTAQNKRRNFKTELAHYNQARLMREIKKDERLGKLADRLFDSQNELK